MNIHVSNLHLNITESDIKRLFVPFGEVKSIHFIRDKWNNRSKGRAFIEMSNQSDGEKAIVALNKKDILGKIISVVEVGYDPNYSTHLFSSKE